MTTSTSWQLARDAAERYQEVLVPAILGPAARALVERAGLRAGEAVLDLGCGTGAATLPAAERLGRQGRLVGVDVNAGMLAVAAARPAPAGPRVEWVERSADQLPFADGSFDVALCAQTLQFLPDRPKALAEARRVLRAGGRLAVGLWCPLPENHYFHALVEAMTDHVGATAAAGLRAAFGLCDPDEIRELLEGAGFAAVTIDRAVLELDLPAPEVFVPRHVGATPMAAAFAAASEEARLAVAAEVARRLAEHRTEAGVRIPFRTHLVVAGR